MVRVDDGGGRRKARWGKRVDGMTPVEREEGISGERGQLMSGCRGKV